MRETVELVRRAVERRRGLLGRGETEVWRAVSGEADGWPGVYVDVFAPSTGGGGAVMNVYEGRTAPGFEVRGASAAVLEGLRGAGGGGVGVVGVYVKPFVRDRSRLGGQLPEGVLERDPTAGGGAGEAVGDAEGKLLVREKGLTLEVRLYDGLSTGVFIDQRENRAWVRATAGGKAGGLRVLNTFSYTCPFSVAAAVGGAAEVTSVDVSAKYLEWGKRNLAHNGIDPAKHRFAKMDTFEFFNYARRKGLRYDLIILDPPSFGSGNKKKGIRAWSAVDDYARLVREAADLLERGGVILASTNNSELCQPGRLEREVVKGYGRKPRWVMLPEAGEDVRGERGRVAWVGIQGV